METYQSNCFKETDHLPQIYARPQHFCVSPTNLYCRFVKKKLGNMITIVSQCAERDNKVTRL
jgi:hypothetical protein